MPDPNRPPAFAQLYFINTEEAVGHQMSSMGVGEGGRHINWNIMQHLQGIIHQVHPYAQLYMHMREVVVAHERLGTGFPNLDIAFASSGEPRVRNASLPIRWKLQECSLRVLLKSSWCTYAAYSQVGKGD